MKVLSRFSGFILGLLSAPLLSGCQLTGTQIAGTSAIQSRGGNGPFAEDPEGLPADYPATLTNSVWIRCAAEAATPPDDYCSFSGKHRVRYGVPGAYYFMTATGGIPCSDGAFGVSIPTPYQNFCDYRIAVTPSPSPAPTATPTPAPTATPAPSPTPGVSWTRCASEGVPSPGDTCSFTGTRQVRYGVPGAYAYKNATGSIECSDGAFGVTVPTAYQNFCDYSSVLLSNPSPQPSATPAPSSTPAPTSTPAPSATPVPTPTPVPSPTPSLSPSPGAQYNYREAGPRITNLTNSGGITAQSGQTYSGLRISNPNGVCVNIDNGVSNVRIVDSDIGPCGGAAVRITGAASNITIEHNDIHNATRGVWVSNTGVNVNTLSNKIHDIWGDYANGAEGHAIEYNYLNNGNAGTVGGNYITGSYYSDILSVFQSSDVRLVDNYINGSIAHISGAPLTMGDSSNGVPGGNNYVARNIALQSGDSSLPGLFGSSGNTIFEYNCFPLGIQVKEYNNAPLIGVTIRKNVIGPGNPPTVWQESWQPPIAQQVTGWSTNVFSSDCGLIPK